MRATASSLAAFIAAGNSLIASIVAPRASTVWYILIAPPPFGVMTPDRPGVSLAWFNAIYQILLGEEKGPRFGPFVALYGVSETRALIADALAGKLVK